MNLTKFAHQLLGLEPPELEDPLGVAGDNFLVERVRSHSSHAVLHNNYFISFAFIQGPSLTVPNQCFGSGSVCADPDSG